MPQDLDQLLSVAHRLADAARDAILPHFRKTDLSTLNKGNDAYFDPVTVADKASEQAMREILIAERPKDGILGEEFGTIPSQNGLTWVLDPIDGTRGFVAGTPTWGVLIACGTEDGPILGIIDQPYIGERFVGAAEHAETIGPLGRSPIRTRPPRALTEATLLTTFPEIGVPADRARYDAVARQAKLVRYGMDCYGYALVAAGQADLVIEAGLEAYDVQAPIAVIEAAGGIVTNWEGGPVHNGGRALAAANKEIHAEALSILQASA